MRRVISGPIAIVAVLTVILASQARAQIPERFENLQVLPKDISHDSLLGIMRGFTGALGVRCQFCHVERPSVAAAPGLPGAPPAGGGPPLDFKSDSNPHKRMARFMLRMVDTLNTVVLPRLPNRDDPPTNVTCVTCHRGLPKPGNIQAVLASSLAHGGADSAIARYRALRNDMASGRYDFREQPVEDVAQSLVAQKRYDDAVALLNMIQEFYPSSSNVDVQLAETYLAKGDREQGIAHLRAALTKNPNDPRPRMRLQQLGVQP
jgi:Tetratricopeptide repeat/Photosynthetic reaction centre cytochrome C subunit